VNGERPRGRREVNRDCGTQTHIHRPPVRSRCGTRYVVTRRTDGGLWLRYTSREVERCGESTRTDKAAGVAAAVLRNVGTCEEVLTELSN